MVISKNIIRCLYYTRYHAKHVHVTGLVLMSPVAQIEPNLHTWPELQHRYTSRSTQRAPRVAGHSAHIMPARKVSCVLPFSR